MRFRVPHGSHVTIREFATPASRSLLACTAAFPPARRPRPRPVVLSEKASPVNFPKLMLIVVPLALVIIGYQWMTRIDRTDAAQVATAFAKNLKSGDNSSAAKFYVPDEAEAWEEGVNYMKSGASERLRERIPAEPAFTAPVTTAAGVTTISSADKSYALEMKQVDGKWYVAKAPL